MQDAVSHVVSITRTRRALKDDKEDREDALLDIINYFFVTTLSSGFRQRNSTDPVLSNFSV
jgi:hypothetical protein